MPSETARFHGQFCSSFRHGTSPCWIDYKASMRARSDCRLISIKSARCRRWLQMGWRWRRATPGPRYLRHQRFRSAPLTFCSTEEALFTVTLDAAAHCGRPPNCRVAANRFVRFPHLRASETTARMSHRKNTDDREPISRRDILGGHDRRLPVALVSDHALRCTMPSRTVTPRCIGRHSYF